MCNRFWIKSLFKLNSIFMKTKYTKQKKKTNNEQYLHIYIYTTLINNIVNYNTNNCNTTTIQYK